jgi:hypothetical protein
MFSVLLVPDNEDHACHAEIPDESFRSRVPIWLWRKLLGPRAIDQFPVEDHLDICAGQLLSLPGTGVNCICKSYEIRS